MNLEGMTISGELFEYLQNTTSIEVKQTKNSPEPAFDVTSDRNLTAFLGAVHDYYHARSFEIERAFPLFKGAYQRTYLHQASGSRAHFVAIEHSTYKFEIHIDDRETPEMLAIRQAIKN